jgi:hypothetical protein
MIVIDILPNIKERLSFVKKKCTLDPISLQLQNFELMVILSETWTYMQIKRGGTNTIFVNIYLTLLKQKSHLIESHGSGKLLVIAFIHNIRRLMMEDPQMDNLQSFQIPN